MVKNIENIEISEDIEILIENKKEELLAKVPTYLNDTQKEDYANEISNLMEIPSNFELLTNNQKSIFAKKETTLPNGQWFISNKNIANFQKIDAKVEVVQYTTSWVMNEIGLLVYKVAKIDKELSCEKKMFNGKNLYCSAKNLSQEALENMDFSVQKEQTISDKMNEMVLKILESKIVAQ